MLCPTFNSRFVPTGDINCGDCDVRSLAEPDRRAFAKFKHLLRKAAARSRRNHLRHNRRNPPSIYAHRMRQLFSTLCPILKASCSIGGVDTYRIHKMMAAIVTTAR
jgi:hypothetical protein